MHSHYTERGPEARRRREISIAPHTPCGTHTVLYPHISPNKFYVTVHAQSTCVRVTRELVQGCSPARWRWLASTWLRTATHIGTARLYYRPSALACTMLRHAGSHPQLPRPRPPPPSLPPPTSPPRSPPSLPPNHSDDMRRGSLATWGLRLRQKGCGSAGLVAAQVVDDAQAGAKVLHLSLLRIGCVVTL